MKEIICLNNNPIYLFKQVDNKISFNCRLVRWIYRKKGQTRTNFYLLSKQLSTKQLRFRPANVTVYFPNKAFTVQKFSVNRQKGNCVLISLQHVLPELKHSPNCISRVHIGLGYRIYLEIVWHEDLFVRFFFSARQSRARRRSVKYIFVNVDADRGEIICQQKNVFVERMRVDRVEQMCIIENRSLWLLVPPCFVSHLSWSVHRGTATPMQTILFLHVLYSPFYTSLANSCHY